MSEKDERVGQEATEPLAQYTMSQEEYDRKMRDVHLGISKTLPDGTPLSEVHENIKRLEKEQDEARANIPTRSIDDVLKPPTRTGDVTVTTSLTGVDAVDAEFDEGDRPAANTDPISDLPDDLPHRQDLINNGHTSWEAVAALGREDFMGMSGIGGSKADAISSYITAARG